MVAALPPAAIAVRASAAAVAMRSSDEVSDAGGLAPA